MGDVTVTCLEGFYEEGLFYLAKTLFHKMSLDGLELFQGLRNRIPSPGWFYLHVIQQIDGVENTTVCHDDKPFDHVLELPDIAWPFVVHEHLQGVVGKPFYLFPGLAAE